MMDLDIPERLVPVRDKIDQFVRERVDPLTDEYYDEINVGDRWQLTDRQNEIMDGLKAQAKEAGLWNFFLPESQGGAGVTNLEYAHLAEVMARNPIASEVFNCAAPDTGNMEVFMNYATKAQQEQWLTPLLAGDIRSSYAMTEPQVASSDATNVEMSIVKDGDEWVLNGQKMFITGGMQASYFVIGARTGSGGMGGISLFFVDADTAGFTRTPIERKMGWWSSDTATLYFDECRVPAHHLMGEEHKGFHAIMNNFNYERFLMAAQMLGMSMRLFDESVAYAQDRQTFNKPLIQHQVIRHKLADMSARIDAMDAYLNQVAELVNTSDMPVAEISKLKFFCSTNLEWIASEAMQIFGGAGYLRGNAVERIYREVKVQAIGGGSQEIMRDLTVKQMGL